MNTKKAALGIVALAMTTFAAGESRAERIRTCGFEMTDTVVLIDRELNILGVFDAVMEGTTAGRHGGVQANTARGRARDRFNTCRDKWVLEGNGGSTRPLFIDECINSNVGSNTGRDVLEQSNNLSHMEYLTEVFGLEVCELVETEGLDGSLLSLVLIGNESRTFGDNRCGSSRSEDFGQFGRFIAFITDLCS